MRGHRRRDNEPVTGALDGDDSPVDRRDLHPVTVEHRSPRLRPRQREVREHRTELPAIDPHPKPLRRQLTVGR
jgi:hypothetical protein